MEVVLPNVCVTATLSTFEPLLDVRYRLDCGSESEILLQENQGLVHLLRLLESAFFCELDGTHRPARREPRSGVSLAQYRDPFTHFARFNYPYVAIKSSTNWSSLVPSGLSENP